MINPLALQADLWYNTPIMINIALLTSMLAIYPTPREMTAGEGSFDAAEYTATKALDASLGPQAYRLELADGKVNIAYGDDDGEFYARQTLEQLLAQGGGTLPNATIADAPAIPLRGVVEGYYGRPWGTKGRCSMMDFMGKNKLNLFVYGPKDDPYHHTLWREPYPEAQRDDFKLLLDSARRNHIRLYWAIHLGGGFDAANPDDYASLLAKLEDMYAIGIRNFAVFFDDFGEADAAAHARIGNFAISEFLGRHEGCGPLMVCPNVYWGLGKHQYVKTLGEQLDASALIVWTGRNVCTDIAAADTAKIAAAYRRAPLVWWNWPVNDYCRSHLLIGRTYGLEAKGMGAFMTNPMENCEASKIGVFGAADWSWNPQAFDSVANWEAAFKRLYPDPEVAKAMRVLAAHNSDPGQTCMDYRREESVGEWDYAQIAEAMEVLKRKLPMEAPQLWWELEGWIVDLECLAKCALRLEELAKAKGEMEKRYLEGEIRKLSVVQADNAERHVAKFQAATFENDAKLVKPPKSATFAIRPRVEDAASRIKTR